MSLNARSPIPLYRQLADRLLSDIDAGTYAVDAKIPSEHELADEFAIGRPTVRQATDLLVRQGRLERRRGSGTYVTAAAPAIDVFSLAGTSAALLGSDLSASLELLSSATALSSYPTSHGVEKTPCFRVQRRALVDKEPVLVETLYFRANLFSGLDKHSLQDRSLSALVRDVYFLEPTAAVQTFSVALADEWQQDMLNVPQQTPLLNVHRSLHFAEHRDGLHANIVCRTDRFDFSQTLYPARAG